MKNEPVLEKIAGISSASVAAKTGRTWAEWLKRLDTAGAATMTHGEIARHLHEQEGVPGWWSQMVTVGYEQARGRREKHQTTKGFSANISRTIAAPVAALAAAWEDEAARAAWLGRKRLAIRKGTPGKVFRCTWTDGTSRVAAYFTAKAAAKCQVAVEHSQLESGEDVAKQKAFWTRALGKLKDTLEA